MISLLLISTNRYKQFVQPLLNGVIRNFLSNHQITVHLFTDELQDLAGSDRVRIEQHIIPPYRFPDATLMRYRVFTNHAHLIKGDFCIYMDVDMSIEMEVGDTFLSGDIIAVRHPGFWYNNGWGSGANSPESKSYFEPELRKGYCAGGVQGGRTEKYLEICKLLADNIDDDTARGVLAEWHDETHWQAALSVFIPRDHPDWIINELTPEYCSVLSEHQRTLWEINHLPARIIALEKDHTLIRS